MEHLFITGAYRSGSTLVEKLLHNHPKIGLGSQPFPYLYFEAKTRFHAAKGIERRYPIGHLFLERAYTLEELNSFLEDCSFTADDIAGMIHDMTSYSGQYMPGFLRFCRQVPIQPGPFYQVYRRFLSALADYMGRDGLSYVGAKESFCEEFVPFFLAQGNKAIIIVRDPRDVVASLSFGQGGDHAGKPRPVLYVIRQWRKSVSFCLHYRDHPDFAFVRYEDLVLNPWPVLDRLTEFLSLPPFSRDAFSQGILDQQGRTWQGNSSFDRYTLISPRSIGRFKSMLPANCIRYIEVICAPELLALGYELEHHADGPDEEAIRDFEEPVEVTHARFEPDYSRDPQRIREEIQRLNLLQDDVDEERQRLWYIFPGAYQALKASYRR